MKTYNELKEIARTFSSNSSNCPVNPFLLAVSLNITIKAKKEYGGYFHDSPAILHINDSSPTIYFDVSSRYWEFYIFHEISHYILKHETDGIKEDQEANMLACCLIAPANILPTYLKNANDLSAFAHIPIGKAEEYWEQIRKSTPIRQCFKRFIKPLSITIISYLFVGLSIFISIHNSFNPNNSKNLVSPSNITPINPPKPTNKTQKNISIKYNDKTNAEKVYITQYGDKYHKKNCHSIKNSKTFETDLEKIKSSKYSPCKICFEQ